MICSRVRLILDDYGLMSALRRPCLGSENIDSEEYTYQMVDFATDLRVVIGMRRLL